MSVEGHERTASIAALTSASDPKGTLRARIFGLLSPEPGLREVLITLNRLDLNQ